MSTAPVRVLVIDDSPNNRRSLVEHLAQSRQVEIVDRASDGEEGLAKALALKPDVITLDLEMPKLDGFAFLRLLMKNRPTPVIVVSSYAHERDIDKALQLGAYDFVAREEFPRHLLSKVLATRLVRPVRRAPARPRAADPSGDPFTVAIAASTGGPPAIQKLLEATQEDPRLCFLICQHMPAHFTAAFAARLDRLGSFRVSEAREGDVLAPGRVFVAPGGRQLVVDVKDGARMLRTHAPRAGDGHAPSADLLFTSVAHTLGRSALGLVLTGMGNDGAKGAKEMAAAGAEVWAESEASAVVFGMPHAAIATGVVRRTLPLAEIGPALLALAKRASVVRHGAPGADRGRL